MSPSVGVITLFQALQLGPLTLSHRVVMSALTRNRSSPDTVPNSLNVEYYRQRARGGAGLIISEEVLVTRQGTEWPYAPGIWNEEQVNGWKKITSAVHEEVGRVSHPDAPEQKKTGVPVYAPSAISARGGKFRFIEGQPGYVTPTETDDPSKLVKLFKKAAENAKEANFDGGGSVKNRSRFGLEALKVLIEVWGADRVAIKLSPTGGYNDMGMPLEETLGTYRYFISEVDKLKLAYICLVRYSDVTDPVIDGQRRGIPHDVLESYRPYVKKSRLFLNGGFSPDEGAQLIADGKADAIVFGFLYIGHPDLAKRIQYGKPLLPEATQITKLYDFDGSLEEQAAGYTDYPEEEYGPWQHWHG
ncbi:FMN-linked oxidoreductase [Marasmius fiardii PR-910]|nr:FMN-linked oxidoreductase [Marasmius fiardii PR-910]